MSTTVSTRSPGTLSPTRQQLDELDALLKRMLDLPVNQLEESEVTEEAEEPPAPPPVQRTPRRVPDEAKITEEPTRRARLARTVEKRSARVSESADEEKRSTPPVSYMVVETASPRPIPAASGFEPQPTGLGMRLMPVTPAEDSADEEAPEEPVDGVGDLRPTPNVAPAAAVPIVVPTPEPMAEPASAEGDMWVPLRSTWKPSAQTWQPLAESWQQARGEMPAPALTPEPIVNPFLELGPAPREVILPPQPAASMPDVIVQRIPAGSASHLSQASTGATPMPAETIPAEPRLTLSAEDAPVLVPGFLLPLVWFNQGFDACMAPLGAPGRWLCSSAGRQILGALGVLSLIAGVAILAGARMGWMW
jgi:hypothetical protein